MGWLRGWWSGGGGGVVERMVECGGWMVEWGD